MYQQVKEYWKNLIEEQLYQIAQEKGIEAFLVREAGELAVNTTPSPDMGDLAFPLFPFAKVLRTSPQNIVQEIVKRLNKVEGIPADSLLLRSLPQCVYRYITARPITQGKCRG